MEAVNNPKGNGNFPHQTNAPRANRGRVGRTDTHSGENKKKKEKRKTEKMKEEKPNKKKKVKKKTKSLFERKRINRRLEVEREM